MPPLDINRRFETLVFTKVGQRATAFGVKDVFRQLPYKYVEYDGSPDRMIEPLATPGDASAVGGLDQWGGQVVGFEFVDGKGEDAFHMGVTVDPKSTVV